MIELFIIIIVLNFLIVKFFRNNFRCVLYGDKSFGYLYCTKDSLTSDFLMIYAGKKRGTFRFNLTIYRVKPLESGRYWT
jgi:hypothetical protein